MAFLLTKKKSFWKMPAISEKARAAVVPLVMSGPSGSGKSTLLKKLLAEFQGKFGFSVSRIVHLVFATRATWLMLFF